MSERQVPAYAVGWRYDCDDCGEEMTATGAAFPMAPMLYEHRCSNGHTVKLSHRYPISATLIAAQPLDPIPRWRLLRRLKRVEQVASGMVGTEQALRQ